MFKTEVTRQTALSLTYAYGLSFLPQQPIPQCVTYQDRRATGGCPGRVRQLGQTNSLHSWRRMPGGSACQQSCVAQVNERVPPRLLYGCAHSSPLQPKGKPADMGKQLRTEERQPSRSSVAVSHRPGEPCTKEDHERSQTYSQIPAKSHYQAD